MQYLAFSPTEDLLVSGDYFGHLYLWELGSIKSKSENVFASEVLKICFTRNNEYVLVLTSNTSYVHVWHVNTGLYAGKFRCLSEYHKEYITDMAVSMSTNLLFISVSSLWLKNIRIIIYDIASRKRLTEIDIDVPFIRSIDVSPDGRLLAVGWDEGANMKMYGDMFAGPNSQSKGGITLYDVMAQCPLYSLDEQSVLSVKFSYHGDRLIFCSGSMGISHASALHVSRREVLQEFDHVSNGVFSSNANLVAVITNRKKNEIYIHDMISQSVALRFNINNYKFTIIIFSIDNARLIIGDESGYIILWDVEQNKFINSVKAHNDKIFSLSLSRDGKYLISGSIDGSVRLWDCESKIMLTPCWHLNPQLNVDGTLFKDVEDLSAKNSDLLKQRGGKVGIKPKVSSQELTKALVNLGLYTSEPLQASRQELNDSDQDLRRAIEMSKESMGPG